MPTHRRRRTSACIVTVIALMALVVACSSSTTPSTDAGAGSGPPRDWAGLLARVPDWQATEGATINAVDYRSVRDQTGTPADGKPQGEFGGVTARLGAGLIPSFWAPDLDRWHELLGFYPYTPDRSFEIAAPPKGWLAVLVGPFDTTRVTAALKGPGVLGPDATSETYAGETYLRAPGEEGKVSPSATARLDRLGRPMRILVAADHLLVTFTDERMHQAIDAWAGRGTAASDPDVAGAGRALDQVKAITVASGPAGDSTTDTTARSGTTVRPRQGVATVVLVGATAPGANDASGGFIIAATPSDGEAAKAASTLRDEIDRGESTATRQPWNELFTVADIHTDGAVLVATLDTDRPAVLRDALYRREPLLDI